MTVRLECSIRKDEISVKSEPAHQHQRPDQQQGCQALAVLEARTPYIADARAKEGGAGLCTCGGNAGGCVAEIVQLRQGLCEGRIMYVLKGAEAQTTARHGRCDWTLELRQQYSKISHCG